MWLNSSAELFWCIASTTVPGLGDSGASVSVCSPKFVRRFGLTSISLRGRLMLRTASGGALPVRHVVRVDFQLQRVSYSWYFYVVESLIQEIIVGRDFFVEHDLLLGFEGGGVHAPALPPPMTHRQLGYFLLSWSSSFRHWLWVRYRETLPGRLRVCHWIWRSVKGGRYSRRHCFVHSASASSCVATTACVSRVVFRPDGVAPRVPSTCV